MDSDAGGTGKRYLLPLGGAEGALPDRRNGLPPARRKQAHLLGPAPDQITDLDADLT